jgi:hypothetical protein
MSRSFSSVTAAAIASVATMAAFALWSGGVHCERARACAGSECVSETAMSQTPRGAKPLGLIDL